MVPTTIIIEPWIVHLSLLTLNLWAIESEDELAAQPYCILFNSHKYNKKDFANPILYIQETCWER